jgi:dTDP-4-amino-4,6-dideoxygalactose transaminase
MTPAPVPLCDIQAQYKALQPELDAAERRVLGTGQAILGPEVEAFEREAAAATGAAFAVGCSSGTDALILALHAVGVGPGDEVIVPPFTFFATASAVARLGAKPVFADIDPVTFNLDPTQVAARVTEKTRAVIPVHLFGQCCDMDPIRRIAADNAFYVVEDAAQSMGAEYKGVKCGTLGEVAAFSFYPTKNLGAAGDAGMVTTNSPDIAARLKALRVHGSEVKYYHKYLGYNMRLDAIQAAVLRVKLPHVPRWLAAREAAGKRYDAMIEAYQLHGFLRRPAARADRRHVFTQYVVRVPAAHRDSIVQTLKDSKVGVEIYYPLSLHQQECFAYLGHRAGDFPAAEAATREVIALPMFPEITEAQQARVLDVVAGYLRGRLRAAA